MFFIVNRYGLNTPTECESIHKVLFSLLTWVLAWLVIVSAQMCVPKSQLTADAHTHTHRQLVAKDSQGFNGNLLISKRRSTLHG